MRTTVYTETPRFTWWGERLASDLTPTGQKISGVRARRMLRYANRRMLEAGFWPAVESWEVEIYTTDGDEPLNERSYNVRYKNPHGGYLEVCRISSKADLDFGFDIGDSA